MYVFKGILLMIFSSFFFSIMAATTKYASQFSIYEKIFYCNLPSMIVLPILLSIKKVPIFGNNKLLLFLRGIFGYLAINAYFYIFKTLSLTDAFAIIQLSPFFIIILSMVFLKEKIKFYQFPIIFVAFFGTLLVIKPEYNFKILPLIIGIIGTIFGSSSQVILRNLRKIDQPLVIINYFSFISGICSGIILILRGNFSAINLENITLALLLGFSFFLAQVTLTKAYHYAQASIISLYMYSQLIFSIILELMVFKNYPNFLSMVGVTLIIICGIVNYNFSNKMH